MKWFPELRALAFLRRIARALERLAAAEERRMDMELEEWSAKHGPRPAIIKKVSFGQLDMSKANARYKERQAAREQGFEVEFE